MSGKATGKVWDLDLPPAQQIILLALADKADQNGEHINPGLPLVAWMTGYSERQVRRIVKQLERNGILELMEAPDGKPTVYRIEFTKAEQKQPYKRRATPDTAKSGVTPDTAKSPGQDYPRTLQEKQELQTPDIASAKTASNGNMNGEKKKESDALLPSIAKALDEIDRNAWTPDDNDTVLRMQADSLIQAFEQAHRESGAPSSVRRGKEVYKAAIRFWKDGYRPDEVHATVTKLIEEHKPMAFVFLGEPLAAHRIKSGPVIPGGVKRIGPDTKPVEWGVNEGVREVRS